MEEIKLIGFKNEEIKNISGKGVSFKKISIPGEDCSNFQIRYEITNPNTQFKSNSLIHCSVSPYQRDISQVTLFNSILIPDDCTLNIQMESVLKPTFTGTAFINFEIFTPIKSDRTVFISEIDRQNAFRVALINVARFYNVPNWEYDDNKTLYDKLMVLNYPIIQLLRNYLLAYNKWFDFYSKLKQVETKEGKRHDLNAEEKIVLGSLIENREHTLNVLQTKFDELQFEKFKKINGLENVDGIIS